MAVLQRVVALACAAAGGAMRPEKTPRSDLPPTNKFFAGVPVLNYDQVQGGSSLIAVEEEEREWVVMFKPGTSYEQMQSLCAVNKKHGCNLVGHPEGIPFLEMRGTESDMEAVLKQNNGTAKYVEPDFDVRADSEDDLALEQKDAEDDRLHHLGKDAEDDRLHHLGKDAEDDRLHHLGKASAWVLGKMRESCNTVCANSGRRCTPASLAKQSSIKKGDISAIMQASAGITCKSTSVSGWKGGWAGAPYLHEDGEQCVAAGQTPSDCHEYGGKHSERRLCYCEAYVLGVKGEKDCPGGSVKVDSEKQCRALAGLGGLTTFQAAENYGGNEPPSCFTKWDGGMLWWNKNNNGGGTNSVSTPVCRKEDDFAFAGVGSAKCPSGYKEPLDESECRTAFRTASAWMPTELFKGGVGFETGKWKFMQQGCFRVEYNGAFLFNQLTHTGVSGEGQRLICKNDAYKAGCSWLTPHHGEDNTALCADGQYVSDFGCLAGGHGEVIQCPRDVPKMCAAKLCGGGQEHCCRKDCTYQGGERPCQASAWVLGKMRESCNTVCANSGRRCTPASLVKQTSIKKGDISAIMQAWASITCKSTSVSRWTGAPYLHKDGKTCYVASTVKKSNCQKAPSTNGERRLCYCEESDRHLQDCGKPCKWWEKSGFPCNWCGLHNGKTQYCCKNGGGDDNAAACDNAQYYGSVGWHQCVTLKDTGSPRTWGLKRIGADKRGHGGLGVTIFVLDTGVRVSHQEFNNRAIPTLDMQNSTAGGSANGGYTGGWECNGDRECAGDIEGHGTHCAGTAAGTNYGVAPRATIRAVKVLDDDADGKVSWELGAVDWIVTKADSFRPGVLSMSFGGLGKNNAFQVAVDAAVKAGFPVVTSAGNKADDACSYYPAYFSTVITVGSIDMNDYRSSFSNYGSCVDIWAPGNDVWSADKSFDWHIAALSGTSMACPHVSGAVALLLQENPSMSTSAVRSALIKNAIYDDIRDLKNGDTNRLLCVAKDGCTNSVLRGRPKKSCPDLCAKWLCLLDDCKENCGFCH